MGTTSTLFYPHTTDWDGTDPASGDVRKLLESLPATTTGSTVDFGTSGSKSITVDPYTSGRTTTGTSSAFGWAINISGSDGMDSSADALRFVPAGSWNFTGFLVAAPVASSNNCTTTVNVYRVAAAPSTTRTLLFSASDAGQLISATGTGFNITSASQPQIDLAHGETIQVSYVLTCTGQVGGLTIDFRTGDNGLGTDCEITVAGGNGVRTQYQETISTVCVGVATVTDGTKTLTGTVRDSEGTPVAGATAKLFDQDTDTRISTYTTGGDGTYTFTRADTDNATYWVNAYSDATHHGTSDRGLTAT